MLWRDHNKKTQFPQPANTPYPTVRTAPIPSPATPPFVPYRTLRPHPRPASHVAVPLR